MKNENTKTENTKTDIIIKELQFFIRNSLIPGDIGPAIYCLSRHSTSVLAEILSWHKLRTFTKDLVIKEIKEENQNNDKNRATIIKKILAFYYPDCKFLQ
jgi:hypothetical protein